MSKADKMFKKMGFKKKEDDTWVNYYNDFTEVVFNKEVKMYTFHQSNGDIVYANGINHLAIHEKMKELGWLDE